MTRRFKFLCLMRSYLQKIDAPRIYLEETIYLDLIRVIDEINRKSTKFIDQYISFSFDLKSGKILAKNTKNPRLEHSLVPHWVLYQKESLIFSEEQNGDDPMTPVS